MPLPLLLVLPALPTLGRAKRAEEGEAEGRGGSMKAQAGAAAAASSSPAGAMSRMAVVCACVYAGVWYKTPGGEEQLQAGGGLHASVAFSPRGRLACWDEW